MSNMKTHEYKSINPSQMDAPCSVCAGKAKDSAHHHGHSPTPWGFEYGAIYEQPQGNGIRARIAMMDREETRTTPVQRDENARFIVKCVNNHETLVSTCKEVREDCLVNRRALVKMFRDGNDTSLDEIIGGLERSISKLETTLAQAEGVCFGEWDVAAPMKREHNDDI